jgi:hypothetical protein
MLKSQIFFLLSSDSIEFYQCLEKSIKFSNENSIFRDKCDLLRTTYQLYSYYNQEQFSRLLNSCKSKRKFMNNIYIQYTFISFYILFLINTKIMVKHVTHLKIVYHHLI